MRITPTLRPPGTDWIKTKGWGAKITSPGTKNRLYKMDEGGPLVFVKWTDIRGGVSISRTILLWADGETEGGEGKWTLGPCPSPIITIAYILHLEVSASHHVEPKSHKERVSHLCVVESTSVKEHRTPTFSHRHSNRSWQKGHRRPGQEKRNLPAFILHMFTCFFAMHDKIRL